MLQEELQIRRRQGPRAALGPFHQHDGARIAQLVQAQILELVRRGDAIEIKMERIESAGAVALEQALGRALDPLARAQRPQQRAGKGGFARAQFTMQVQDAAAAQRRREPLREGHCRGLIGQVDRETWIHGFRKSEESFWTRMNADEHGFDLLFPCPSASKLFRLTRQFRRDH
jgi:hypothetical protein